MNRDYSTQIVNTFPNKFHTINTLIKEAEWENCPNEVNNTDTFNTVQFSRERFGEQKEINDKIKALESILGLLTGLDDKTLQKFDEAIKRRSLFKDE